MPEQMSSKKAASTPQQYGPLLSPTIMRPFSPYSYGSPLPPILWDPSTTTVMDDIYSLQLWVTSTPYSYGAPLPL